MLHITLNPALFSGMYSFTLKMYGEVGEVWRLLKLFLFKYFLPFFQSISQRREYHSLFSGAWRNSLKSAESQQGRRCLLCFHFSTHKTSGNKTNTRYVSVNLSPISRHSRHVVTPRPTERPLLLSRQGPVRHTPVQYEVRMARYNYTHRGGSTKPGCY